ncbi:hypothetical protein LSH36_806g01003 [Paralvinella palmiformis]|uniref:Uncharacterized protein n=1 Tax=Paralvinella palmiformis TaxID=53620 RepID=A0AAD9J0N8_9ANNE|nr:hypothetical protein LSH36_806g01003 [Paralvinella palmiformis]
MESSMEYLPTADRQNLTDVGGVVMTMESGKKHVRGSFTFRIEQNENGSFIASIIQKDHKPENDDVGALYYVIVVIFLYGCSILMMIASYIRKNNVDRKLNRYLKEMATVRKRERQIQLFNAAAKAAAQTRKSLCLEGTEISLVAEKWSRFNEALIQEEQSRRQHRRRHHSVDSTTDESSRKPSDRSEIDMESDPQPRTQNKDNEMFLSPARIKRPSVRIVCEPSDPESDNDAFLTDDQDENRESTREGATGRRRDRKRNVLFETTDGETSADDDNDGSRAALLGRDTLEPEDPENQVTEDSESELFLGRQDSRRIQWLDFQVVSSV